jgi:hypothetical protein
MKATSRTVRLFSATLAVLAGSMLVLAKAHFSDEFARLATRHDAFVLPVVEVVGERPFPHVAELVGTQRSN